jgi:hypothetical protein
MYPLHHRLHPPYASADLLDHALLLPGSHGLYPSHLACLPDHPDPLMYGEMFVVVIRAVPLHLVLQLEQVPPPGEFHPSGDECHHLQLQVLTS